MAAAHCRDEVEGSARSRVRGAGPSLSLRDVPARQLCFGPGWGNAANVAKGALCPNPALRPRPPAFRKRCGPQGA